MNSHFSKGYLATHRWVILSYLDRFGFRTIKSTQNSDWSARTQASGSLRVGGRVQYKRWGVRPPLLRSRRGGSLCLNSGAVWVSNIWPAPNITIGEAPGQNILPPKIGQKCFLGKKKCVKKANKSSAQAHWRGKLTFWGARCPPVQETPSLHRTLAGFASIHLLRSQKKLKTLVLKMQKTHWGIQCPQHFSNFRCINYL